MAYIMAEVVSDTMTSIIPERRRQCIRAEGCTDSVPPEQPGPGSFGKAPKLAKRVYLSDAPGSWDQP